MASRTPKESGVPPTSVSPQGSQPQELPPEDCKPNKAAGEEGQYLKGPGGQ